MMKFLLHRSIRSFERKAKYDATYWHEVVNAAPGAGARLFGLPMMSQYSGPSTEIWAGASFASALEGDCGPCAQLVLDQALEVGVSADALRACLRRDFEAAGDVGLGFRFAEAAIAGDLALDDLRAEIRAKHGDRAVIAAGFAACSSRAYPVLKRALGHAHACRKLDFGDTEETVLRPAA
ncbi:MAG: hypothetical protein AAFX03_07800 [Pseudomonadota bacterium]